WIHSGRCSGGGGEIRGNCPRDRRSAGDSGRAASGGADQDAAAEMTNRPPRAALHLHEWPFRGAKGDDRARPAFLSRKEDLMHRFCTACKRQFTPEDFVKEQSRGMESERRELGLEGVRFLYYKCRECGHDEIFVDVLQREGESAKDFETRRAALEAAIRQCATPGVNVVLTAREPQDRTPLPHSE